MLRRRRILLFSIALLVAAPCLAGAGAAAPAMGLGHDYDLSGAVEEFLLADPLTDPSITKEHPLYVRIRAPRERFEPTEGQYDWSEADRVVDPYRAAGYQVILALYGATLPTSQDAAVLKGWLDFVRAAALHFKGRVLAYEIGSEPNRVASWSGPFVSEYAYVLKQSSVTVRSADPEALVAQGALGIGGTGAGPAGNAADAALDWQAALYGQEIATYVDALPILPGEGVNVAKTVARVYDLLLANDPSAQVWAVGLKPEGETDRARAADLLRRFAAAQGEGAALVTFDLEADVEARPEFPGLLLDIHRLFQPGYGRRPGGGTLFEAPDGLPHPATDLSAWRFFDGTTYQGLVVFEAGSRPAEPAASFVLDTAAVRGAAIYDLVGGTAAPAEGARADFASNTTHVPVTLRTRPQVLLFARVPIEGFEVGKEQVEVTDTGLITVEEIVAGHQRFMADQSFRLKTYRAQARVEYHYKISGSNTIDVAYDNQFFRGEDGAAEWEQTALYINGVRWKGKFPDIPFIQPDKVLTLPLDINLNRDYDYEYLGRDTNDDYDCYVVGFKPRERGRTLYEGKAWIETRTFALVRTAVVQHGLEPPVTSNEENDHYAPVAGPDGTTYWLLARVDGQQVYITAGRNLVVLRNLDFSGFQINDTEFAVAKQAAYASEAPILRDTEEGLRYLEPSADGTRTLADGPTGKTLFAIGGIAWQPGFDYPVPLIGVNYFNYNVRGSEAQINAFLAGAINSFTVTDPHLFGPFDGTVEAFLLAIGITDNYYVGGEELTVSAVDVRPQDIAAWLGLPLGSFFRLRGGFDYLYQRYNRNQETNTFVVPSDTSVAAIQLAGEFNRAGWTVTATGGRSSRSRWEAWGDETLPTMETLAAFPGTACDSPGSCLAEFDPGQKSFKTWEVDVSKQFFLSKFQKVRLEGSMLGGSNLDRFSQFSIQSFGTRVRGFSGAGVRFERGAIGRAQYSFNIGDVIRFDASLDYARIRDPLLTGETAAFTGFGVSGTMLGPWQTLVTFDIGVALTSDYENLAGSTEAQIVFFKFF